MGFFFDILPFFEDRQSLIVGRYFIAVHQHNIPLACYDSSTNSPLCPQSVGDTSVPTPSSVQGCVDVCQVYVLCLCVTWHIARACADLRWWNLSLIAEYQPVRAFRRHVHPSGHHLPFGKYPSPADMFPSNGTSLASVNTRWIAEMCQFKDKKVKHPRTAC